MLENGAQVEQVDEHRSAQAVVVFEFEAYPEPKVVRLRGLSVRMR